MARRKQVLQSESEEEEYAASKYVDVEASEEDEEEDDEDLSGFINEIVEEAEDDEAVSSEAPQDKEATEEEEYDDEQPAEDFEELSKKLEQRYLTQDAQLEVEEVPQQMLLPTDRHPRLWLVRCAPKKERHVVLAIMRRYLSLSRTDSMLNIVSALHNEGMKGYIYVEAYQKQHVQQAIEGVAGAFRTSISQVPLKEMTDVLYVPEIDPVLYKKDGFFRLTKGRYAGDVVQIEGLAREKCMVTVKIVPRLPPAEEKRLFDPKEHEAGEVYKASRSTYIYKKGVYREGYLVKDVPVSHLTPTPAASSEEKKWFSAREGPSAANVTKGEFVEVVSGGLRGATGMVVHTGEEEAVIEIDRKRVKVPLAGLRKKYALGDEVTIQSGRKRGITGFILRIDGNVVRIGIDGFAEEVEVRSSDLKLGSVYTQAVPEALKKTALPKPRRHRRDPLTDKQGQITAGKHKGKRGTVKDVRGDVLRVQLSTDLQCVSVPRGSFELQGRPGPEPQAPAVFAPQRIGVGAQTLYNPLAAPGISEPLEKELDGDDDEDLFIIKDGEKTPVLTPSESEAETYADSLKQAHAP